MVHGCGGHIIYSGLYLFLWPWFSEWLLNGSNVMLCIIEYSHFHNQGFLKGFNIISTTSTSIIVFYISYPWLYRASTSIWLRKQDFIKTWSTYISNNLRYFLTKVRPNVLCFLEGCRIDTLNNARIQWYDNMFWHSTFYIMSSKLLWTDLTCSTD